MEAVPLARLEKPGDPRSCDPLMCLPRRFGAANSGTLTLSDRPAAPACLRRPASNPQLQAEQFVCDAMKEDIL